MNDSLLDKLSIGPTSIPNLRDLSHELPIILASVSPRRSELLTRAEVRFTISPSGAPEVFFAGEMPEVGCRRLALEKAQAVASTLPGEKEWLVIGADTIVVIGDEILGKPTDPEDALAMLEKLNDRTHTVHTAVALIYCAGIGETFEVAEIASAAVSFGRFTRERLAEYVATGDPLDKAGSYGAQSAGAFLVDSCNGGVDTVVGLPLATLDDCARVVSRLREKRRASH